MNKKQRIKMKRARKQERINQQKSGRDFRSLDFTEKVKVVTVLVVFLSLVVVLYLAFASVHDNNKAIKAAKEKVDIDQIESSNVAIIPAIVEESTSSSRQKLTELLKKNSDESLIESPEHCADFFREALPLFAVFIKEGFPGSGQQVSDMITEYLQKDLDNDLMMCQSNLVRGQGLEINLIPQLHALATGQSDDQVKEIQHAIAGIVASSRYPLIFTEGFQLSSNRLSWEEMSRSVLDDTGINISAAELKRDRSGSWWFEYGDLLERDDLAIYGFDKDEINFIVLSLFNIASQTHDQLVLDFALRFNQTWRKFVILAQMIDKSRDLKQGSFAVVIGETHIPGMVTLCNKYDIKNETKYVAGL